MTPRSNLPWPDAHSSIACPPVPHRRSLLKLPNFKNKKVLREKLLCSIRSGAGFELS